jgi:hypothetical protein
METTSAWRRPGSVTTPFVATAALFILFVMALPAAAAAHAGSAPARRPLMSPPPRDRRAPTKPTVDESSTTGALRPVFIFGARDNRTPPLRLRFRCAIDSPLRHPCRRTFQPLSDLAFGRHELSVVAVDRTGNVSRVTNFAFSVVGTWDAAADFPRAAPSENPAHDQYGNTVWTYLYSQGRIHDPMLYRQLPHFDLGGGAVAAQWNMGGTGPTIAFPLVGVFGSSSIGFHPDRDSFAILGWRSPYTGTVAIEFTVRLEDPGAQNGGNGITWSIDRGNSTLQTQVLTYGYDEHAAITTDVTLGDQFYVVIDNRGDSNYDTTVGEFRVHTIFP